MRPHLFLIVSVVAFLTVLVGTQLLPPSHPGRVLSWHQAVTPSPQPSVTPSPSPVPSSTPTPTPRPTPRPTRIPTPTPVPQPKYTSEQVYNFIDQYAGQYHVDPNVMRRIAVCETGFNPAARNHIYAGLFQYDAPTWESFRRIQGLDPDPDLRFNAQEAIRTTAYLLSQNRAYLWPNCHP